MLSDVGGGDGTPPLCDLPPADEPGLARLRRVRPRAWQARAESRRALPGRTERDSAKFVRRRSLARAPFPPPPPPPNRPLSLAHWHRPTMLVHTSPSAHLHRQSRPASAAQSRPACRMGAAPSWAARPRRRGRGRPGRHRRRRAGATPVWGGSGRAGWRAWLGRRLGAKSGRVFCASLARSPRRRRFFCECRAFVFFFPCIVLFPGRPPDSAHPPCPRADCPPTPHPHA